MSDNGDLEFSGKGDIRAQGIVPRGHSSWGEWARAHRSQAAGGIRIVSHSFSIVSGVLYPSVFRMLSGAIGMGASAYRLLFGNASRRAEIAVPETAQPELTYWQKLCTPPGQYVIEKADSGLALAALSLMASGMLNDRPFETAAAAWTAGAFMLRVLGKEVVLDNDTKSFVQKTRRMLKDSTVLGGLMLQAPAMLVIADSVTAGDPARLVSGVCLSVSSAMMTFERKSDFKAKQAGR